MATGYTNLIDEIDPQSPAMLKQGDRVKLEFVSNPSKWIRASQIAIIEYRLNSNKDIDIIRADYWGDETITFEVEVKSADAVLNERIIIALIMSANPAYFYLAHKPGIKKIPAMVEKTVEAVIEKTKAAASWTLPVIALAGIAAIVLLLKK